MASPPQPAERRVRAPAPAAGSFDILRKIFLLLDSPADLARACAASPAFRRIITEPGFLRRFRALQPPPLLGIRNGTFLPAEPPHPSAAVARKFVDDGGGAIDFTCRSFLPAVSGPWDFCESCDGRALLTGKIQPGGCCGSHRSLCRPSAVCDPLHRRYVVLPAIPEELAALVDHGEYLDDFKPFLAPRALDEQDEFFSTNPPSEVADDDGEKDALLQPSYRVMCLVQRAGKLSLFVFSSSGAAAGRPWRTVEYDDWNAQGNGPHHHRYCRSILRHNYVHGRFYWTIYPGAKKILVIDARRSTPELSIIDSPPDSYCMRKTFVEAAGEQERLAMIRIYKHGNKYPAVFFLTYALQLEERWGRWETETIISLPLGYNYYRFIGVAGGYLLLEGTPEDRDLYAGSRPDMVCFSLDLRTLQLERFCGSKYTFEYVSFYTGCPRYLSPPTV